MLTVIAIANATLWSVVISALLFILMNGANNLDARVDILETKIRRS
nr:hypothetical protein [Anaerolineae bacterium]